MADFLISEDHLKKMAKEAGLLSKALTDEPTFKINPKMGEGKPTKEEKQYRQELQDHLKTLHAGIKKADDDEIPDLINQFIEDGQKTAESFINQIYDANVKVALAKLKELGIKRKAPTNSEAKKALLAWQMFSIERMGIILELDIKNERLAKRYFEAAYGSQKKKD